MGAVRCDRCSVFLFVPLVCFAAAALADGSSTPVYRASTSEVRITFFATDLANHPINNITQDDFAVVDGDLIVRDFRSVDRSEQTTLDVVIMIDTSKSIASRLPAAVKEILSLLAQNQAILGDNISLVSFSGLQPVLLCAHNCARPEVSHQLVSLNASGPTPLFDAIDYSTNLFARNHASNARPVLILFSDGEDTISTASLGDAVQAIVASSVPIYAVNLGSDLHSQGTAVLRKLAASSGGRYFAEARADEVAEAVIEDMRASYVVTYPVPNTALGFHSLRILPKHDLNLQFHCRAGYYFESDAR